MDKLYTVAGVSALKGSYKARFANDARRGKVLEGNGHTDVRLVTLPQGMTQVDAAKHLLANAKFQDAAAKAALEAVLGKTSSKSSDKVAEIKAKNLETIKKTAAKLDKMEERGGSKEPVAG